MVVRVVVLLTVCSFLPKGVKGAMMEFCRATRLPSALFATLISGTSNCVSTVHQGLYIANSIPCCKPYGT